MITRTITMTNDEGDEIEVQLPAKWIICGACRGQGKSSAYLGAYGREEFEQAFSPEEQEMYFAGAYDRPCDACSALGRVLVPDEEATLTDEQRAAVEYEQDMEKERAFERAQYRAESGIW